MWHFTRLVNLSGILRHGLIGRSDLEEDGLPTKVNDEYRLDRQENAICCSITHPNYKMFYRLRLNNPKEKWVVLGLKKSILWKKNCAFCVTNAANRTVTCIPIDERKGIDAFNRMFNEIEGKPSREELRLSDRCPTDPQAEVLVLEPISVDYIIAVVTNDRDVEKQLKKAYPSQGILYHSKPFSYRHDYDHWR